MNKKVVMAGFDLEVFELLKSDKKIDILGYVDVQEHNNTHLKYFGYDEFFLKSLKNNHNTDIKLILSMDLPYTREKLFYLYGSYIAGPVVHKTAIVSNTACFGQGVIIQANTMISAFVNIGNGCFINHNASVHHESIIGDFSIIAPRATVLGRVNIGNRSYIGAASLIKQGVSIGSNVVIGAGAVVVNDIPDNVVVVGNPAKRILKVRDGK